MQSQLLSNDAGLVALPVYNSFGTDAPRFIVEYEEEILDLSEGKTPVEIIILMNGEDPQRAPERKSVRTCKQVLVLREASRSKNKFQERDNLAFIIYSSGLNLPPKGCILICRAIVAGAAMLATVNSSAGPSDRPESFLPLAQS